MTDSTRLDAINERLAQLVEITRETAVVSWGNAVASRELRLTTERQGQSIERLARSVGELSRAVFDASQSSRAAASAAQSAAEAATEAAFFSRNSLDTLRD
ncbi:MAG: hypothetical protein H7Y22_15165 [Gemmatimonadaceae bacterium]|nr:hypothetical protein [Gloeobacterales cyanobacterium ES-bin-141]